MAGTENESLLPQFVTRSKKNLVTWHKKVAYIACVALLLMMVLSHKHNHKNSMPDYKVPHWSDPTWTPSEERLTVSLNGSVASDVEVCSQMGVDVLKQGGFAADAAVTVGLCIGTINSMSSGIGGGCFITSRRFDEDGAISIDAREMAPGAAHRDMFAGREQDSKVGGLAVATPGEIKGLYELYRRHGSGKIAWEDLVVPVAKLARDGWDADILLGFSLQIEKDYIKQHADEWEWAIRDGRVLRKGDHVSRPAYADTLETIAKNGSDAVFYDPQSPLVHAMVESITKNGGIVSHEDFGKYQVRVEPALKIENFSRHGYDVYTSNGASSGLSLMAGLNMLNQFEDYEGKDYEILETQRLVETMKWMGAVRSNLGDVSVYSTNSSEIADRDSRYKKFSSLKWARETKAKISDLHTLASWKDYHPAYQMNDPHGTSHFSVVDKFGNAVGMTTTVNLLFGSRVCDPATGVIFNDEMDDFSMPTAPNAFGLEPSVYNYIEPYKRPLSSSSPTIVLSGDQPDLVIGAAGGSHITPAVLEAIVRTYHYNLTLLETIAFPRIHHQLLPNVVALENPAGKQLAQKLEQRGHEVVFEDHKTAMNGIRRVNGVWHAVSDYWRKKGVPAGY